MKVINSRQRTSVVLLVFTILMSALFVLNIGAQAPYPKLAETEWLEANLADENLRIVDLRASIKDYWTSHIPGAVQLSPDALRWPDQGVPGKVILPDALARLLGEMGIENKTAVLAYSEESDFRSSYLAWALDYMGHDNFMLLNGGFTKWSSEGRPVTQDYPKIKPKKYRVRRKLNERARATLEEVKKFVEKGGAVIIDVRPVELYTGESGPWKRKGHIKGAINRFWLEDTKDDGTWKSKEDIKKAYEAMGATPDKQIIVSCGQGQMSSFSYFTLKHILGYPNVKNYDGSFNEWSNIGELPVETGMGMASKDVSKMMDGPKLLEERCTACHNLTRVHEEKADREEWGKIIARMTKRGAKLTDAEASFLLEYLSGK